MYECIRCESSNLILILTLILTLNANPKTKPNPIPNPNHNPKRPRHTILYMPFTQYVKNRGRTVGGFMGALPFLELFL